MESAYLNVKKEKAMLIFNSNLLLYDFRNLFHQPSGSGCSTANTNFFIDIQV